MVTIQANVGTLYRTRNNVDASTTTGATSNAITGAITSPINSSTTSAITSDTYSANTLTSYWRDAWGNVSAHDNLVLLRDLRQLQSWTSAAVTYNPRLTIKSTAQVNATFGAPRWAVEWVDELLKPSRASKLQRKPAINHRTHLDARAERHSMDQATPQELVALGLLRQMVSSEDFREYLRRGILSVRGGVSGWTYAIPRYGNIDVFARGERLASLCVHLKHEARTPPTDEVVAKMLMVELDEADLWKRSNVHNSIRTARKFDDALTNHGHRSGKLMLVGSAA